MASADGTGDLSSSLEELIRHTHLSERETTNAVGEPPLEDTSSPTPSSTEPVNHEVTTPRTGIPNLGEPASPEEEGVVPLTRTSQEAGVQSSSIDVDEDVDEGQDSDVDEDQQSAQSAEDSNQGGPAAIPHVLIPESAALESNAPDQPAFTSTGSGYAPRPQPRGRVPSELALPRWQPDNEVTYCPICRTQFSFFVRKHHCRRCGRVVCASCSPHRITIPREYIVRHPGELSPFGYAYESDQWAASDFLSEPGGERVRLCNPCVPDPNTTPLQHPATPLSPRSSHIRSQSGSSTHLTASVLSSLLSSPGPSTGVNPDLDNHHRSRSVTMGFGSTPGLLPSLHSPTNPAFDPAMYSTISGPSSRRIVQHTGVRGPRTSVPRESVNRPLPARPIIPEEDECPVCHRELPSRELPDFEQLRENHINNCISTHSTYPSTAGPSSNAAPLHRKDRGIRRTGMFPYIATEKDCVDDAECTICFEEYQVGVPMARLECLCRFHRACIGSWFQAHPGRCPLHQHGDFGY